MRRAKNLVLLALVVLLTGDHAAHAQFSVVPLALTGEPAPEIPTATFRAFGLPAMNSAGDIAFSATITGPGITSTNEKTLYLARESALIPKITRTKY